MTQLDKPALVLEAVSNKTFRSWEEGVAERVYVSRMSDGRYCIYRWTGPGKKPSGYTVYETINDLMQDFMLFDQDNEMITEELIMLS